MVGRCFLSLFALSVLIGCVPNEDVQDNQVRPAAVVVERAWMRQPVPGTDKSVGYFVLHNGLDHAVVLTGARSDQVRTIEMHETSVVDGVSRMRRLAPVVVQAGESVEFVPGGRHLMLFGVKEISSEAVLTGSAVVSVVLEFQDKAELLTMFLVRSFKSTDG